VPFDPENATILAKNKDEKINAYLSSLRARDGNWILAYLKTKVCDVGENLQKSPLIPQRPSNGKRH